MRKIAGIALLLMLFIQSARAQMDPAVRQDRFQRQNLHSAPGGYRLVWADEFNQEGSPDSSRWVFEHGFVRNEEFQWYQEANAYCHKGLLVIEARAESKPNPWFSPGSRDWRKSRDSVHYTSSCILTRGKNNWTYGRFEMRARIDIRAGLWPAWWTLGISRRWPANGEIDIMEYYRGILLANFACLGSDRKPRWFSNRYSVDSLGGPSWAAEFHVWKMEWDSDRVSLFVDNRMLNSVPVDSLANKDGSGFNPFRQPHYMLLNLAVGGQNGGDPSATDFPAKFEIDYVRVYQRE